MCQLPSLNPVLPPEPRRCIPTLRHPGWEEELAPHDVLSGVERKVAANQVMEQDAQGPDGGWLAMVAAKEDPLWRAVLWRSYGTQLIRPMLLPPSQPAPQQPASAPATRLQPAEEGFPFPPSLFPLCQQRESLRYPAGPPALGSPDIRV